MCGKCRAPLLPAEPVPLTDASFDRYVDAGDMPVWVDFSAEWCPPCRFMNPILADPARQCIDIRVAKVDTTTEGQLPLRFKIRGVPTLILFRCGTQLARLPCAALVEQLVPWMDGALQHASAECAS